MFNHLRTCPMSKKRVSIDHTRHCIHTSNKNKKIHVRIHSTSKVLRAGLFILMAVLEVTQRVPPTCTIKTHFTYLPDARSTISPGICHRCSHWCSRRLCTSCGPSHAPFCTWAHTTPVWIRHPRHPRPDSEWCTSDCRAAPNTDRPPPSRCHSRCGPTRRIETNLALLPTRPSWPCAETAQVSCRPTTAAAKHATHARVPRRGFSNRRPWRPRTWPCLWPRREFSRALLRVPFLRSVPGIRFCSRCLGRCLGRCRPVCETCVCPRCRYASIASFVVVHSWRSRSSVKKQQQSTTMIVRNNIHVCQKQ